MEDAKTQHKLDKYLEHLNPQVKRKLSGKDQDMMDRYWKIFMWRCKMFSPEQVRKMAMQEWKASYSWACEMYSDMEYVFGNTNEINKSVQRRILLEYYHTAMSIAIQNSKADPIKAATLIANVTDKIAALIGLHDGSESIPPELLMPKRTVTYVIGRVDSLNVGHEMPQMPARPMTIPLPNPDAGHE
jgi:hypothetical protein